MKEVRRLVAEDIEEMKKGQVRLYVLGSPTWGKKGWVRDKL